MALTFTSHIEKYTHIKYIFEKWIILLVLRLPTVWYLSLLLLIPYQGEGQHLSAWLPMKGAEMSIIRTIDFAIDDNNNKTHNCRDAFSKPIMLKCEFHYHAWCLLLKIYTAGEKTTQSRSVYASILTGLLFQTQDFLDNLKVTLWRFLHPVYGIIVLLPFVKNASISEFLIFSHDAASSLSICQSNCVYLP